jgi:hypothetical protein
MINQRFKLLVALVTPSNNSPHSPWDGILPPPKRLTNNLKKIIMFKLQSRFPIIQEVPKVSVSTNRRTNNHPKLPCTHQCTSKILLVDVVKSLSVDFNIK